MTETKKPDFKARNTLLIKALLGNQNPLDNLNVIASKLFEVMTGHELCRDTDIANGEDYAYLAGQHESACSLRLHPRVSQWLGWYTNSGHSTLNEAFSLIMLADSKEALAETLRERFDEFQKPKPCVEQIQLNDKPLMQGDSLFAMFERITGASFYIGGDNYDEDGHRAYHEQIEVSLNIKLRGQLIFIDGRGQLTDYDKIKSLFLGNE